MSAKAILSASVSAAPIYVEDVFSTFLYTGTGAAQTITNGIDLSGKGGLVWLKGRNDAGGSSAYGGSNSSHLLFDTARGMSHAAYSYSLRSNGTNGQSNFGNGGVNAISTGFDIGFNGYNDINYSGNTYCSWTFRKAAKFFDVVTFTTAPGSYSATVNHSLGSTPGCIIVKCTTTGGTDWNVWHRSLASDKGLWLQSTAAQNTQGTNWITANSTSFSANASLPLDNSTYVAYLFAHDAGGFGTAGTDSVVSCGSFTGSGAGVSTTINLGYEPQFILAKRVDAAQNWIMVDTMRGLSNTADALLYPNLSNAESSQVNTGYFTPTATGFVYGPDNYMGDTAQIIYMAIRRGPMKTPTVGTSVFAASTTAASTLFSTGITSLDSAFIVNRTLAGGARSFFSRLTASRGLDPTSTAAEGNYGTAISWDLNNAFYQSAIGSSVQWLFRRAPGFFDVVICKQTGSAQDVNHNLGVAPELLILKDRTSAVSWQVGAEFTSTTWNNLVLNSSSAGSVGAYNNYINAQPTSSVFRLGANLGSVNDSFVAYLFATLTGVSKVGSYTGTGTTLNIDCGFTAGARFVMIKRTDSTGDWYVWDTARGIISGNDPYLLLNSTAAEVTGTDYIDPLSSGFEISSTAPAAINANGGTYIFLAIA